MTVGERIKERERFSISQTELAQKIGVSKQTLYKYETNIITNIPSDTIERTANVLNCSPAYLMGWDDEEPLKSSSTTINSMISGNTRLKNV